MNTFIPFLLLIFSLIPPSLATPTIKDACKSIAHADSSVPYNFCVDTLESKQMLHHYPNPLSYHTLADIAIHVPRDLGMDIYLKVFYLPKGDKSRAEIEEELRTNESVAKKQRYDECSEMYWKANNKLNEAEDKIREKRYRQAKELVRAASGTYRKCVRLYRRTGHLREIPVTMTQRVELGRSLKITEAILRMAR